jgi:uncharacterized membrane protein YdjX (TVP38/TMEM64 family)
MTGWAVALILYILPILSGIRYFDEHLEVAKEWMRESGDWYPGLAIYMAIIALILWPLDHAMMAISPRRKDE